jgi:diadenosine tetraphosphate (Ap4A) HIT family hydrolase
MVVVLFMLYDDFLKKMPTCPFCDEKDRVNRVILENRSGYLTYALSPYHKHHLLVIPKKHRLRLLEASALEQYQLNRLIDQGVRLLRILGYNDLSVLVRDGHLGKSIDHLHYHVIPNTDIGDVTNYGKARKVLTKRQIASTLKDFANAKLKLS